MPLRTIDLTGDTPACDVDDPSKGGNRPHLLRAQSLHSRQAESGDSRFRKAHTSSHRRTLPTRTSVSKGRARSLLASNSKQPVASNEVATPDSEKHTHPP